MNIAVVPAFNEEKRIEDVLKKIKMQNTISKILVLSGNVRYAKKAAEHEIVTYINYPFSISETFQIKNLNANYLPSTDFSATAQYQSQSIEIDINTEGLPPGVEFQFPVPPLDQYALTLNLTQTIYDGGITKALKELEKVKTNLQTLKNEFSFQDVKKQLTDIWFSVLFLQKTQEQIENTLNELDAKRNSLKSGLKNGVITKENYDLLTVNILQLKQRQTEINSGIENALAILSIITGKTINSEIHISVPNDTDLIEENNRIENKIFNYQNEIYDNNIKLIKAKRLPKIGAYAIGGYGNPGLTMLKDEWNPYFIVGANLHWNIWDWNTAKRNKQIQKINQESINNRKTSFEQSVSVEKQKFKSDIEKYKLLMTYDKQILSLQENICKTMRNKLKNGTINSTEYISAINKKQQATIQFEIHKLKLLESKYDYLIATGNF